MTEIQNTSLGKTTCKTTCPYCGVGCGVLAEVNSGVTTVRGDNDHPANFGRLCVKGSALHETLDSHARLLHPKVNGKRATWSDATSAVAAAIRKSVDTHGPESIGFYLSGQLLTEDYYVANKLAKGFIGTPHVDTNSRLCMSSAVAAHKRAFGADVVPGCYEDLEQADLLILVGSNLAWNHPILYQRIKASARKGRRVVVIDPRETATTELADLHLKLKPGTDTVLFNGLLAGLRDRGVLNHDYIAQHCTGFDAALEAAVSSTPTVSHVARACDLDATEVSQCFDWFAQTPRTVTVFSQGVNQSSAGTDKANAIINCHLATGRVGVPGASPFSVTGQPNAMGGREVGGLANTLAAHMDYDSPDDVYRVTRFWQSPGLAKGPGYKAVDLFDAVHRGEIKVLWIMATNPAVSLPDNARVREALRLCPTVIVSDCMAQTDTTGFADILLPAQGWGEKDGTVTNSERRISRQRRFLPATGEARADWQIVSEVGAALGHRDAFGFASAAGVFREHAALSAFENKGTRPFDLGALCHLSDSDYDNLEPLQWPLPDRRCRVGYGLSGACSRSFSFGGAARLPNLVRLPTNGSPADCSKAKASATGLADDLFAIPSDSAGQGTARLFGDGLFATADQRARFIAIAPRQSHQQPDAAFPLVINTGRIRDQWHTMTRTGLAARLWQHRAEPFMDVHPADLEAHQLTDGQLGRLQGPAGDFVGRVRATPTQRRGDVFIPIHWNQQFSGKALASDLIAPQVDPVSGQPDSKHGVARLTPVPVRWEARLLCLGSQPRYWQADHWSRVPLEGCDSWWLAGNDNHDWTNTAKTWLGGPPQVVMADPFAGRFRAARFQGGRLLAVLIVEPTGAPLPDLGWLAGQFQKAQLDPTERRAILACRDAEQPDVGAIVCSCFQVGEKQIQTAIENGAGSVEALGESLRCGTNCGSCVPELKALVDERAVISDVR